MVETGSYAEGVEDILISEDSQGSAKLVLYCSGSLKKAKRPYDTTQRVRLVIDLAIFSGRSHLKGWQLTIPTDDKGLQCILSMEGAEKT